MRFDMISAYNTLAEAFPGEYVRLRLEPEPTHVGLTLYLTAGAHHTSLPLRQPCVPDAEADAAVCARLNADFQRAVAALKLEKETCLERFVREVKALIGPAYSVTITERVENGNVRLVVGGVNLGLYNPIDALQGNLNRVQRALAASCQQLTPEHR